MVQKFDEGKCDKFGLENFEQEKVDQPELATNITRYHQLAS